MTYDFEEAVSALDVNSLLYIQGKNRKTLKFYAFFICSRHTRSAGHSFRILVLPFSVLAALTMFRLIDLQNQ